MKYLVVFALLLANAANASAQVASHTSTGTAKPANPPIQQFRFKSVKKP